MVCFAATSGSSVVLILLTVAVYLMQSFAEPRADPWALKDLLTLESIAQMRIAQTLGRLKIC